MSANSTILSILFYGFAACIVSYICCLEPCLKICIRYNCRRNRNDDDDDDDDRAAAAATTTTTTEMNTNTATEPPFHYYELAHHVVDGLADDEEEDVGGGDSVVQRPSPSPQQQPQRQQRRRRYQLIGRIIKEEFASSSSSSSSLQKQQQTNVMSANENIVDDYDEEKQYHPSTTSQQQRHEPNIDTEILTPSSGGKGSSHDMSTISNHCRYDIAHGRFRNCSDRNTVVTLVKAEFGNDDIIYLSSSTVTDLESQRQQLSPIQQQQQQQQQDIPSVLPTCIICLLEYDHNDCIYRNNPRVCNHMFHTDCITKWIQHQPPQDRQSTLLSTTINTTNTTTTSTPECPCCRRPLAVVRRVSKHVSGQHPE